MGFSLGGFFGGGGGGSSSTNTTKNTTNITNQIDTQVISSAIENGNRLFYKTAEQGNQISNNINATLLALVSSQRQGDSAQNARMDNILKGATLLSGFTIAYLITPKNKGKK